MILRDLTKSIRLFIVNSRFKLSSINGKVFFPKQSFLINIKHDSLNFYFLFSVPSESKLYIYINPGKKHETLIDSKSCRSFKRDLKG